MKTIKIGTTNDSTVYANWNCMGDGFVSLGKLSNNDLKNMTPDFEIKCDSGVSPITVDQMDQNICDEAYAEYIK